MRNLKLFLGNPVLSVVLALMCQAVWATGYVLIKVGFQTYSIASVENSILFAGYRFLLAGAFLLGFQWISNKRFPLPDNSEYISVLEVSFFQTVLTYGLQFPAMLHISSLHCSIVNGLQFILISLFACLFFKNENLSLKKILAFIIAFGGILFCFLSDIFLYGNSPYKNNPMSLSFQGESLMFLSVSSYALSVSIFKKRIKATDIITFNGYSLFIGGLVFFLVGKFLGGHIGNGGIKGILSIVALALMSSVCSLLWTSLLKYNPVGRIAVCQCINPISGAICASLVLGESVLQLKYIVALILITLGILIYNFKQHINEGSPKLN